jgi:hypothetical protein
VQALQLFEHLGAIRIIIVINAVNSRQANSSWLGVIIDELRFQIGTTFSCNIIWCKRELNKHDIELARIGSLVILTALQIP